MEWTTVKTDWKSTDFFNFTDFNRINDNISFLITYTEIFKDASNVEFSGWSNIYSYATYYTADMFNRFEDNLYKLCSLHGMSFTKNTFYDNGAFITADELNRIENTCLQLYNAIIELSKQKENYMGTVYSGEVYA